MGIKTVLLVVGLVAQAFSYPRDPYFRTARQTPSSGSEAAAAAGSTESDNGEFGIGAAAGIGGLGRQAGIGSFNADTKSNPFLPWGAFAGMNLGSGGRIGAGCSGLSCGVQLGNFALATPQLLGLGQNFLNNRQQQQRDDDAKEDDLEAHASSNYEEDENPSYRDEYYDTYYNPSYNYPQSDADASSGTGNANNFDPFGLLQRPFQLLQQIQQRNQHGQGQNVADFARFGGANGAGGGNGFFGGASTSTFGSSSNGGKPIFSSTSTHVDSDGKVTTIESGSDQPDKITTGRIGNNGGGVYAASGSHVDSDGKVTNFKDSGTF